MNDAPNTPFSGFWKRLTASLIDDFILWLLLAAALSPIFMLSGGGTEPILSVIGVLILIAVPWIYTAGFEASAKQATPGKLALGMEVTNLEGEQIGFGRATARYFGRIASATLFFVGYLMAGWTEKKQALHDKMAGCLVVDRS